MSLTQEKFTSCDLDGKKFKFTLNGRDLHYYGFETVEKFKEYNASISINTLFDLNNNKFEVEYSDAAFAVRKALLQEYKQISDAQRLIDMSDDEVEAEWDRLDLYEKLPAEIYQKRTILFCLQVKKVLVFLEMGLGKSYIGSTVLQNLVDDGKAEPGRILIIAPKTLHTGQNWPGELVKFSDLHLKIVRDYDDFKVKADVYLINSEKFRIMSQDEEGNFEPANPIMMKKFQVIIFDESAKLKSGTSQITETFVEYVNRFNIPYRFMMTGLPSPNNAFQLWGQAAAVGFWLGDDYSAFENRYGKEISFGPAIKKMVPIDGAIEEMKDRIRPVSISFTEEVLNLPPYPIEDVKVVLDPEHMKLYKQIEDDYFAILDCKNSKNTEKQKLFVDNEPALRYKLMQTLDGFVKVKDRYGVSTITTLNWNPKLDRVLLDLERILEDPENNAIIWTRFREEKEVFYREIQKRWLTAYGVGGMSEHQQKTQLSLWLDNKNCRVMIANPGAFMAGHTWLKANYTLYPTPVDNHEHYAQSRKRNHRRGQTRTVTEYRYVTFKTLEKQIWSAMEHKKRLDEFLKSR